MNEPLHPTARNLGLGRLTVPLEAAARDAGMLKPGELAAYESGATIVLQIGAAAGAIRTVTLA